MKELKKLSLREEVEKEAQEIEQEVSRRPVPDDLTVSEDMETSLFNKIQDYEYDQRFKRTVRRHKKRKMVFFAVAAILILVCGSVMTGVGSKSYWKVLIDGIAGKERTSHVNVEDMVSQKTEDINEIEVYNEISKELGISPVHLRNIPEKMHLKEYELDRQQNRAVLLYDFNGQIIEYMMYMNDSDSSHGWIEIDRLVDQYQLKPAEDVSVQINEYEVENKSGHRFAAEFEYMDVNYRLVGIMEKEEFDKIIENLGFYDKKA